MKDNTYTNMVNKIRSMCQFYNLKIVDDLEGFDYGYLQGYSNGMKDLCHGIGFCLTLEENKAGVITKFYLGNGKAYVEYDV